MNHDKEDKNNKKESGNLSNDKSGYIIIGAIALSFVIIFVSMIIYNL